MPKARSLRAALDSHQGVDYKLEKQKRLQKQAEKRKRKAGALNSATGNAADIIADNEELEEAQALTTKASKRKEEAAADRAERKEQDQGQVDGWESDEEELANDDMEIEVGQLEDESESDSEDEFTNVQNGGQDDEDDIPYSDIESLASEDRADVVPHQKLTINNTAALQKSLKSFALPASLPFSAIQAITSAEPTHIKDVEDDLNRELAFYKQSLDAVKAARLKLKQEGVSFTRPADYFAEMVKSEEQMGKVKQKLVDEAARKKASTDARRQRDLKKFGKAVQIAKTQERDRAKRDTLDKINTLKRKRQGGDLKTTEEDLFDVALEDAAETAKADKADRRAGRGATGAGTKRQKKDAKFGYGGKKRFAKSNDAQSSGDTRGYSVARMKGKTGKPGKQRPGKARRARSG